MNEECALHSQSKRQTNLARLDRSHAHPVTIFNVSTVAESLDYNFGTCAISKICKSHTLSKYINYANSMNTFAPRYRRPRKVYVRFNNPNHSYIDMSGVHLGSNDVKTQRAAC